MTSLTSTEHSADYIRPGDLEVATSNVFGLLPGKRLPATSETALEALDNAIRPALLNPPCRVAFSGGRDSSAVLAVATDLARREGHALPVPVTRVYPNAPDTDESQWQRLVIDHLGLSEWTTIEFDDHHELLGAAARESLRRRGLIWPPALHIHSEWYQTVGAGSVLTGEGGDEVFGSRRVAPLANLLHQGRPSRAAARRAAHAVLPASKRRAHLVRQWSAVAQPWLRPHARQRSLELLADELATQPLRYDHATWWITRRRGWAVYTHNNRLIAADHEINAVDPLLDRGFLAALARCGGVLGFAGRTAVMQALFSELLPSSLLERRTKAAFNEAYHGRSMRAFAREWDGSGVNSELVDSDRLRREWLSERPAATSALLLQSAWLRTQTNTVYE